MSVSLRAASLCTLVLVAACGQTKMVQTTGQIRDHMFHGNYKAALATLRQSKQQGFKEQDRVVYWMNEGMLLHLIGDYKNANQVLTKSERRSKELYTVSISKGIKAAFTSQAATDYPGEDYEKVLVNVFKALNFLGIRNQSGALVEARKINEKLKLYNTRYKHKNVYNQDAFAHWLMGLLFEMEGSHDDARIAYVHAMKIYEEEFSANYNTGPPPYLAEDIVRASILSKAPEEAQKYREKYGEKLGHTAEALDKMGEVVLIHLNGQGPSKTDYMVTCWFLAADRWGCDGEPGGEFMKKTVIHVPRNGTVVKVAFPQLHVHPPSNHEVMVQVGPARGSTAPALPISRIAVKVLADKMRRIFRDAIIRVVAKLVTQKAAGAAGNAAGGKLLGWVAERGASAAMQAFEESDKRAWTTLPSRIDVARLMVPPGTHNVSIKVGRGRSGIIRGVKVEPGKRVVITYRTIP